MPAPSGYAFYRALTDGAGTSLANYVCKISLTSANFDFPSCGANGYDLRIYDVTADSTLNHWTMDFDPVGQTASIYFKTTLTSHTHRLYYCNPSASNASVFANVFTHGTGFDADWGDMSTAVAGTYGVATRIAGPSSTSDIQNLRTWKIGESPILQLSDLTGAGVPVGNYTGLREFCVLRDAPTNQVVTVGGKYYVFFTRRPSTTTDHHQTWRAEATSKYGPWSNFVQIYDPPSGIRLGYPGSALKIGSTYYVWLSYGWKDDGSGSPTPGLSIYYITSTDLSAWTAATQCLTPGVFTDQISGTCTDIGNPKVIQCADGVYYMMVEGYNVANGKWACYGATSSNGTTWTVSNSGAYLLGKGAASTWDLNGVANPGPWQMPDGSYVMAFNGSENSTNYDWQMGLATASGRNGPFTESSFNPIAGKLYGTYGIETSALCLDTDGSTPYHVCQKFATNSNTAAFYKLSQTQRQGGLLLSRDAPGTGVASDAGFAGRLMDAGNWTAEARSVMTSHRTDASTPICLGLWNSASMPTPGPNAGLLSLRCIEMFRWSADTTSGAAQGPGDITFSYWDSGGTRQFWNGSSWGTATTGRAIAVATDEEVLFTLSYDGTNYIMKAVKVSDGSTIAAPTAVAASSIRSMAAGKFLVVGDPFTDAWESGLYNRIISVRPYAATEPSYSVGSKVPLTTSSSIIQLLQLARAV